MHCGRTHRNLRDRISIGRSVVARVLDDLHNQLREEELEVREGETVVNEMLEEFKTLQTKVNAGSTGQLIVSYQGETAVD